MKRERRSPHSIEFIANYFKSEGCVLLEKIYRGNKAPLRYRCKCGSLGTTCFNNFSRGHRCWNCFLQQFEHSRRTKQLRHKLREQAFTITDVAKIIGVTYSNLWRCIRVHKSIPEPTLRVVVRKYYTKKDIARIERLLK